MPKDSELDKLERWLRKHRYNIRRIDEQHDEYPMLGRHQILVLNECGEQMWDAICHPGSYGYEEGLLEIMGEIVTDGCDVEGYLTADEIIKRLKRRERK